MRKADRIFVISNGEVKEDGCHDDLMKSEGEYYQLVRAQVTETDEDEPKQSGDCLEFEQMKLENIDQPNETNRIAQNSENIDKIEKFSTNSSLWAIMKYNSPEWWFILIGSLCCMINGASMPLYSIFFGKIVGVSTIIVQTAFSFNFSVKRFQILSNQDKEVIQREMNVYCISFVGIAVGGAIATIIQVRHRVI